MNRWCDKKRKYIKECLNTVKQVFFHYQDGSLVDHRAYKPYTIVGPPALGLVLDPLTVIFLNNRLYMYLEMPSDDTKIFKHLIWCWAKGMSFIFWAYSTLVEIYNTQEPKSDSLKNKFIGQIWCLVELKGGSLCQELGIWRIIDVMNEWEIRKV